MKQTLALLLLALVSTCCVAWTISDVKPKTPVKIYGNIYTFAPPYENANHLVYRPWPHTKIYIRPFSDNIKYIGPVIDSVVSDSAGDFSIYLEPGYYSFITAGHAHTIGLTKYFNPAQCDSLCFAQQRAASDALYQVKEKDNSKVQINLQ